MINLLLSPLVPNVGFVPIAVNVGLYGWNCINAQSLGTLIDVVPLLDVNPIPLTPVDVLPRHIIL